MSKSHTLWLWLLLVVQAACATFFVFDGIVDWTGAAESPGFRHIHAFELVISLALVGGLVATALHIRSLTLRGQEMRRQLDIASGAFAQLIDTQFTEWGLSTAEREVAMLAIKGLSVADIAAMRQTKEGTIKAQCASVYRKAGVSGRLQLLSYFIEELVADPVLVSPSKS
ncbi:helix-turn-helix transcriptional regulator [Ruegeria sp. HKCCD8929]|uniref:helix-turn-helix transcriptional regulator n=1 Tax=Ruegeria sp. HKCCD8929 TaxID=2683006 RepID=UPI0014898F45|nr:helix-turn-helix transcriptional regulator [Ruegeria sp. HKCCD8929]